MAAAVSSMENGIRLGSRVSPQQQQQQQQQQQEQQPHQEQQQQHPTASSGADPPRTSSWTPQVASPRPSPSAASPRASASSRATSAFTSGLTPSAASLLPSAARVAASGSSFPSVSSVRTRSSSGSSNSSSSSGGGGGGGFWSSIMSLGAAALPASLSPLQAVGAAGTSSSPRRRGPRRHHASVTGARTRTRSASFLSPSSSAALSQRVLSPGVDDHAGVADAGRGEPASSIERFRAASPPPVPSSARGASADRSASAEGPGEHAAAAAAATGAATTSGSRSSNSTHKVYLEGGIAVYTCATCRAHLATRDHVVSECFHGHRGRAFLFERCVNVAAGRPEDRLLLTGMHVVADISCKHCGAELGWKYEEAADKSQKYKEGKFILEKYAITLEGRSGDSSCGSASASASALSGGRGRYGTGSRPDRCEGSSSIIGWGADNAPFADGGRW
eukprot:g18480.t2